MNRLRRPRTGRPVNARVTTVSVRAGSSSKPLMVQTRATHNGAPGVRLSSSFSELSSANWAKPAIHDVSPDERYRVGGRSTNPEGGGKFPHGFTGSGEPAESGGLCPGAPTPLLTAVVNAAAAIPETRRCVPCLAAEELAECGRVRHAYVSCDGCAGEFGVHEQAFGLQKYPFLDEAFCPVAGGRRPDDARRRLSAGSRSGSAVMPYESAVGSLGFAGTTMNRSRYRVERMTTNVDRLISDQPNESCHQRRGRPHRPPGQAAMITRFTQEVPSCSAEGTGQHERDPEQNHAVDAGEVVGRKQSQHD